MSHWLRELEIAQEVARAAGQMLQTRRAQNRPLTITHKGVIDLVTEMDRQVETFVRTALSHHFPHHDILGEEEGGDIERTRPRWLVDPLDGTTNYAHGYPCYAVSLALEVEAKTVVGVVYNPVLDECFAAVQDGGATLNNQPIHVSTTADLAHSLLASGFPYDAWTNDQDNGREWHRFLKRVISLRSDGSAALDLCHVAAGRLDGYWELDLEPWDMAAGALIVTEAGGEVTRVDGGPFSPYTRSVLASNGRIHREMLAVMSASATNAVEEKSAHSHPHQQNSNGG